MILIAVTGKHKYWGFPSWGQYLLAATVTVTDLLFRKKCCHSCFTDSLY